MGGRGKARAFLLRLLLLLVEADDDGGALVCSQQSRSPYAVRSLRRGVEDDKEVPFRQLGTDTDGRLLSQVAHARLLCSALLKMTGVFFHSSSSFLPRFVFKSRIRNFTSVP